VVHVVLHKIILDREEKMFLQKLLKNVNFCEHVINVIYTVIYCNTVNENEIENHPTAIKV